MSLSGKSIAGALALLLCGAGLALAQSAPPAQKPAAGAKPPAASSEPDQTTAAYGDWTLRCVRAGEGAAAARVCEIVQAINAQGNQQPVARVAIGRPAKSDAMHVTLMFPPAISFSEAPQLRVPGKPGTFPVTMAWRRCLPAGCFADGALSADGVRQLKERTEPLEIALKDANEQQAVLPLSVKGLAQALDALAKETTPAR